MRYMLPALLVCLVLATPASASSLTYPIIPADGQATVSIPGFDAALGTLHRVWLDPWVAYDVTVTWENVWHEPFPMTWLDGAYVRSFFGGFIAADYWLLHPPPPVLVEPGAQLTSSFSIAGAPPWGQETDDVSAWLHDQTFEIVTYFGFAYYQPLTAEVRVTGGAVSVQYDYTPAPSGQEAATFTPVPEPGTWVLLGSGMGVWWMRRRLQGWK
jgi:hypothetical protein